MTIRTRWAGAAALGIFLAGGIAAGTAVYAQGPGARHGGRFFGGPGGPGHGMALLREIGVGRLDLTDAQEEQVTTVVQARREELRQIGERLRVAQQGLNDAVASASFDEGTIRARSADVAAVQADAAVLRARMHGEVWSILTAEQQQKATENRAKMAERIRQRWEERRK